MKKSVSCFIPLQSVKVGGFLSPSSLQDGGAEMDRDGDFPVLPNKFHSSFITPTSLFF